MEKIMTNHTVQPFFLNYDLPEKHAFVLFIFTCQSRLNLLSHQLENYTFTAVSHGSEPQSTDVDLHS